MAFLFGKLQRRVPALQTVAATSIDMNLGNDRLRNVSYVNQYICQAINLLQGNLLR